MGRDLAPAAREGRTSPAGGPARVLPCSSLRLGGSWCWDIVLVALAGLATARSR